MKRYSLVTPILSSSRKTTHRPTLTIGRTSALYEVSAASTRTGDRRLQTVSNSNPLSSNSGTIRFTAFELFGQIREYQKSNRVLETEIAEKKGGETQMVLPPGGAAAGSGESQAQPGVTK